MHGSTRGCPRGVYLFRKLLNEFVFTPLADETRVARDRFYEASSKLGLVAPPEPLAVMRRIIRLMLAWQDDPNGFVGAGDGPCVLLMVGARIPGRTFDYPEQGAKSSQEAYVDRPHWRPGPRPDAFG